MWVLGTNAGPLREQQVLSVTETSPQSLLVLYLKKLQNLELFLLYFFPSSQEFYDLDCLGYGGVKKINSPPVP